MLWTNSEISKYFSEDTVHILDYDCEYTKGLEETEKFPEFKNKVFRFFNTDTSMTTGHFKMGDVETGAVMNLTVSYYFNYDSSKLCQSQENSDIKSENHSISMI